MACENSTIVPKDRTPKAKSKRKSEEEEEPWPKMEDRTDRIKIGSLCHGNGKVDNKTEEEPMQDVQEQTKRT